MTSREELIAYGRRMGWRPTGVNRTWELRLTTLGGGPAHLVVQFKINGHIDLAIGTSENGNTASVTGGVREVKRFLRERRHRR